MIDWNVVVVATMVIGLLACVAWTAWNCIAIYGDAQYINGYQDGAEDERKWGQAIRDALEEDDE